MQCCVGERSLRPSRWSPAGVTGVETALLVVLALRSGSGTEPKAQVGLR